jgi:hypothetical protein
MSGTLTASSVKPGVRRSKKYTSGRVCEFAACETQISIYNKKKILFLAFSCLLSKGKRTFIKRPRTKYLITNKF